ncbi:MAG: trigger factor [Pirellulaceae bacterium]|nr:MAG: trigger factor [Pirellulaceae bacterium]
MTATETGSEQPTATGADAAEKKLTIDVKVEEKSPCERHVVVTIPEAEVARARRKIFDEIAPKAELPGFRAGKAPRKLVESRFRDQVDERVKTELVMESLEQITEGDYFTAIGEPEFDFVAIEVPDEGDFVYEFDIEVRPDFDTPEWKGLELRRPVATVDDKAVNEHLKRVLVRLIAGDVVEDGCQPYDTVTVDVRIRHEGKLVDELEDQEISVRDKLAFADVEFTGFADAMGGKKAGETVTLRATVSEEAKAEELRGKEIEAEFTIKEVRRIDIDSLTRQQLDSLGFDNVDELRDFVRQELERQVEYQQRSKLRREIVDQLLQNADWELPPTLVERQTHRELRRMILECQRAGLPEEVIKTYVARQRLNAKASTERALREHFVLERIGEDLQIEPTEQDYEEEILTIAERTDSTPRAVRAQLQRGGEMDALRNEIIERKVLDAILEAAKITDVEAPELLGENTDTYALDHAVAGKKSAIPEAKHADDAPQRPGAPKLPEKSENKEAWEN